MANDVTPDPGDAPEANTMELFNKWFNGIGEYLAGVSKDLEGHQNPAEYCRQMDELIAAKESEES